MKLVSVKDTASRWGTPRVVESEAKIVRMIYALFLDGKTPSGIASTLTRQRIPSPAGRPTWTSSTVTSILSNEKYKGDALLQKRFTVDFLSKKMKRNEGEVPSYYVRNSHPAIVSEEVFDMVQHELKRRKESGRVHSGNTRFSGKVVCGECGGMFGSKLWHSTDKYRRIIWQCNHKFKNDRRCTTPHLNEDTLKAAFIEAVNDVLRRKDAVFAACDEVISLLCDTSALDAEWTEGKRHVDELQAVMQQAIRENTQATQNQAEYDLRFDAMTARYQEAGDRLREVETRMLERKAKREALDAYMAALRRHGTLAEFDEGFWNATVETVTVNSDGTLVFRWKDGGETVWMK